MMTGWDILALCVVMAVIVAGFLVWRLVRMKEKAQAHELRQQSAQQAIATAKSWQDLEARELQLREKKLQLDAGITAESQPELTPAVPSMPLENMTMDDLRFAYANIKDPIIRADIERESARRAKRRDPFA